MALHTPLTQREISFRRPAADTLQVRLTGRWLLRDGLPTVDEIQQQLDTPPRVRQLAFETQNMTAWDTGLLTFLRQVWAFSKQHQISVDQTGLPEGVQRLLALATAVPEREGTGRGSRQLSWLAQIGANTLAAWQGAQGILEFIGAALVTFLKFVVGRARFRRIDLALLLQECGAQALGIVTLISFLIGLILAFMGAVQLRQFGAQIYVADLVGLGMTREMGAIMTGVIMAGRTGAAFAAQLGTMQVNEEIDALTTMGISSMEFLVLPRMLALIVRRPLLCLYANIVGMLAGLLVATGLLNLSLVEYVNEICKAVDLVDVSLGLFKRANALLEVPELKQALVSLEDITTGNKLLLQYTDDQIAALAAKVGGAGDAIRSAAVDAQKLLRNVDGQVAPLANSAQDTLTSAKDALSMARGALGQAQKTLSSLTDTASPALKQGEKAFTSVAHLAGEDGVLSNDLGHTLKAIEEAARSIRVLADSLQRNPEALLHGRSK